MTPAQISGVFLGAIGLAIIGLNAYLWWAGAVKKSRISGIPVLGGLLAATALYMQPEFPRWVIGIPLLLDMGGVGGIIVRLVADRMAEARFRKETNANAETLTGPLVWSMRKPAPPFELAAVQEAEAALGMAIPPELLSFLEANGNGGYLRDSLSFPIPPECGHAFHLRCLIGIGRPGSEHDLVGRLQNYAYDQQLAPGLIPVFEDDFGAWLCMDQAGEIWFWEPEEGPEGVTRVAGSLAEVVSGAYRG